jgi:hypothetical protein
VGETQIRYSDPKDSSGMELFIPKSEVLIIRYENGTKDIFGEEAKAQQAPATDTSWNHLYMMGESDAMKYYKGYKPAATGTLITALLSPLAGLVPAIACSVSRPKEQSLTFPDPELKKMKAYHTGNMKMATKRKQGKVWKNWGIAFAINVALVLVLNAGQ